MKLAPCLVFWLNTQYFNISCWISSIHPSRLFCSILYIEVKYFFLHSCVQNCERHVILSSRLILETRCTGLLCGKIDFYTWSIKYREKDDPRWQKITNLEEIVLTYDNSPNLVTAQGKLRGNATYQVTVNGETSQGHSSIGAYSFVTNTPPSGGICKVDKTQGKAWETNFVFSCIGWQDDNLPLKFQFSYYSSDGIEMIFQSGNSSTATGKLPVGDPNTDYKLDIKILVIDALGSSVDIWIDLKVSITLRFKFLLFFFSCSIQRTVIRFLAFSFL